MQVFVGSAPEPLQQEARSREEEEVCVSAVAAVSALQQHLAPALSTPARLSVSTTETGEDLMLSSPENEEDSKWFLHERDLLITEDEDEDEEEETFNWEDFIHAQGECNDSSSLEKAVTNQERSHFYQFILQAFNAKFKKLYI